MCIRDSPGRAGSQSPQTYPQTHCPSARPGSQYAGTVSYTHLDVYKRQVYLKTGWPKISVVWRAGVAVRAIFTASKYSITPVSYTHLFPTVAADIVP